MDINWPTLNSDCPAQYRICAQGVFDLSWLDMLSGEWIIAEPQLASLGCTILVGYVVDQAALLGVLNGLYGLGLYLLLVECLEQDEGMARPVEFTGRGCSPQRIPLNIQKEGS